ncbi:MAG TPA: hypothetical protein VHE55_01730 [Fimbriimonadaceae bacterium]|nr:hypothetical protein [Fimbriimonadaceae bacterium]
MKLITTGCLLAGALTLCSAQNITPMAPKKGVWSLGFSVDYFKAQHSDSQTSLRAVPTYFVTDNIEVGLAVGWDHSSGFDSTFFGPEVRYYFGGPNNSLLKPFVGAVYQVNHATGESDSTLWGGEVGAHWFVANNVAVTGTFIWEQFRQSGATESEIQFDMGFTIFFAGLK